MNQSPANSHSKIYSLLVVLVLVWGLNWPINKIGLYYMPPLWFAACRLLIATISMFIVVAAIGKLVLPRKEDLRIIFTIGLLQMGLFMVLINVGLQYVDAGRSAILVYTTPFWVLPIAIIFFHEVGGFLKWLGFAFGMTGVLVLFSPWGINWEEHGALVGNGILMLASLCWAGSMLCARYMRWSRSPLEIVPWQLLVGTIPVVCLAFWQQPDPIIQWNHKLILALLYNGVVVTAFGYWVAVTVNKELPSTTVSLSMLAIPVTGLISSILLLGESLTLSIVLALLLIIGGLACVILHHRTPAK